MTSLQAGLPQGEPAKEFSECNAVTTDLLPDDVLARVFQTLAPAHLHWVEVVCRRFRVVVVRYELWRQACAAAHPPLAALLSEVDDEAVPAPQASCATGGWLPSEAARRSAFFKRLHYCLTAPQSRESLIAEAVVASSTDHPQESIDNVLSPEARSRNLLCYWSSTGSEDEDSVEVLSFVLAHPLCLLRQVDLRPFKAFFQWEHPIYSPKSVRIRLGGLDCFGPDGRPLPRAQLQHAVLRMLGSDHVAAAAAVAAAGPPPAAGPWALAQAGVFVGGQVAVGGQVVFGPAGAALGPAGAPGSPPPPAFSSLPPGTAPRRLPASTVWESEAFPVQQADELQQFDIGPALCVGGLLQVELLGKVQRQAPDDLYYACLAYVRALGVPLLNFRAVEAAHAQQAQSASPATPASKQLLAARPTPASPHLQGQGPAAARPPSTAAAAAASASGPHPSSSRQRAQQQQQQEEEGVAAEAGHAQEAAPGPSTVLAGGPGTPLRLRYVAPDPLQLAGGLARVSEGGRVWRLRQRAAHGGQQQAGAGGGGGAGGGEDPEGLEGGSDVDLWDASDVDSLGGDGMEFDESSDSELDWDEGHPFAD